jgi:hypothetical protein
MAGVIPQVMQVAVLNTILDKAGAILFPLTVRLFSNDITPSVTDEFADYTEVTGGGYANVDIADGTDFTVSAGTPSEAEFADFIDFLFTGTTGGTGKVFGYYISDDNNVLVGAQRGSAPSGITIANGSLVRVLPILKAGNAN